MKELYELKEKLCDELKDYSKKDMSAGSLDVVDKLTHTIKNLDKIIDKYEEDGYSNNNSYYNNRMEYSRGRGRNARRDSMGRYSSRDGYINNGYSYHDDMMGDLRALMEDAPDDKTRHEFKRFIEKMESM